MDFPTFLFGKRWLDSHSYQRLLGAQYDSIFNAFRDASSSKSIDDLDDVSEIHKRLAGQILEQLPVFSTVLQKSGANNLQDLLELYWKWHLEHQEPVSDYSLLSRFGKRLYVHQLEKRMVGQFVAAQDLGNGVAIVRDNDSVVIPEGSSSLYAGLAIGAFRSGIQLVSSNTALVREYHENPSFNRALSGLTVIGGDADLQNCGAVGGEYTLAVTRAIEVNPGATVVVCSAEGFLADDGPYAPDYKSASNRFEILDAAVKKGVRELVFILDFSKMLPASRPKYGIPICNGRPWYDELRRFSGSLSIVTCPPEPARVHFDTTYTGRVVSDRPHRVDSPTGQTWRQYEACVGQIVEIIGKHLANAHLYEAYRLTPSVGAAQFA